MAKHHRIRFGKRVFLGYVAVVVVAILLCGIFVSSYVNSFISNRTVDFNAKGMSAVVYELDSLYQRLEQFSAKVYEQDIYTIMRERSRAYSYDSLKRQIEFEDALRNAMLLAGLMDDLGGMLVYVSETDYYYVGEGVLKPEFQLPGMPWYDAFVASGKKSDVFGPTAEEYRAYSGSMKDVVLFVTRLNTPAGVGTDQVPVVVMAVRYEAIQRRLDTFFGGQGAYVISGHGEEVYANGLDEETQQELYGLWQQDMLEMGEEGVAAHRGGDRLITGIYAPNYGWTICATNSMQDIYADTYPVVGIILLIFLGCGLLACIVAWYATKKVMVPINTMNSMISQMSEKEDAYIESDGDDEVSQIGNRFNIMKHRMQEMSGEMYLSEVREKQAQLSALQAQINPHFLYNTLGNIYSMAQYKGEEEIAALTASLSSMMRYTLDSTGSVTDLEHELTHVKEYISILNTRHDGAITYEEQVDVSLYEMPMMRLLLQPLVENAWLHGISKKKNQRGRIVISAELMEEKLLLTVADDGAGIGEERLEEIQHKLDNRLYTRDSDSPSGLSIGLKNVYDRIRLTYGDEYGMRIDSKEGEGTKISLLLKY
ncbi:MAG: histidine kinase [Oscillospiraceae bacterium]